MNQTDICQLVEKCDFTPSQTFPDYIILSPLPVIGTVGIFLYKNRPKVLTKTILADYIHADGNTRIHEYMITLSYGLNKIPWNPIVNKFPIKILKVLPTTRVEYYYTPRDNDEKVIPPECRQEDEKEKEKNIHILHLDQLKDLNIESFYVITHDKEQSEFSNKISMDYFPNSRYPTRIEIRNGNKVPVRSFELVFTEEQTLHLRTQSTDFPQIIKWNNDVIDDCVVIDSTLRISVKEIPKSSVDLSGTIRLNLI